MHLFRLFGVSVLIPLISVGLCATSGESAKKSKTHGHGTIKEVDSRQLSQVNSTLPPVHFPSVNLETRNATGPDSISPRSLKLDSLPTHPHPLHLNVHLLKPIANSTSIHVGEGRGGIGGWGQGQAEIDLNWVFKLVAKAITSYAIVAVLNILLAPILKKFGFGGGPYWETSIKLGNEGQQHLFNFGPKVKKLRISFGSEGTASKDEEKEEEEEGHGQGWGPETHGHQQPGHVGFNPYHAGPGWLSYDQAALALPQLDKYAMKAAKKAMRYTKKAQRYASKASHYAAKAQAAKLSIKPLYANGFIHPGAAQVPGIPSYGWGK